MKANELSDFGVTLIFIIGAVLFIMAMMSLAWLLRTDKPNAEKLSSYECGEDTEGSAWGQFNSRFYIVALIFILFDVELVLLFPWATVFGDAYLIKETNGLWGWFSLAEVGLFVVMLALGLAYAWVKGYLDWVKPEPVATNYKSNIPADLYAKVNEKYS